MAETPTTLRLNGEDLPAKVVPVTATLNPGPMEWQLEDGTRLAISVLLFKVIRVDNKFNEQGEPVYHCQMQNFVGATYVPPHLRQPAPKASK